jgi:predicted TIM-barrel fold metal-dependent hydrolase
MKNSPFGLAGICDCHTHVFAPQEQIPFLPNRHYTPDLASIEQLHAMHAAIGVERVVIVHPSPYGADNTCLLWALKEIGPSARGVAVIDENTSAETLQALHAAGTRGTRINLETHGLSDPSLARQFLFKTIDQVAPLGWHVQMFTNLGVISNLHDTLMACSVPIVIDHFGRLKANETLDQPGFDALLSLVKAGKVYVKLSAPYRVSEAPNYSDVAPFAQRLIQTNPDRMLWGTDWPHPFPPKGHIRIWDQVEKFHNADNQAALARLVAWAGSETITKKILVDNPARLYDF